MKTSQSSRTPTASTTAGLFSRRIRFQQAPRSQWLLRRACDGSTQVFPPTCRRVAKLRWLDRDRLAGTKAPIKQPVGYLSEITGRSVQDKTNLTARYDIDCL